MSPLNIRPEEEVIVPKKKKNKSLKVLLGVGVLVAVPVIGSTLAGSISLNSGGSIEFGQGSAATVACDSDGITVTPTSAYSSGAFKLDTITLSGIDLTANHCAGKTFKVYIDTAGSLVNWVDTDATGSVTAADVVTFTIPGTISSSTTATALTSTTTNVTYAFTNGTNAYKSDGQATYDALGKVVITLTQPYLSAASVDKIVIQTS